MQFAAQQALYPVERQGDECRVAQVLQDKGEAMAAHSKHRIRQLAGGNQGVVGPHQHPIAHLVSVQMVDPRQVGQIDQQQAQTGAILPGTLHRSTQLEQETLAIDGRQLFQLRARQSLMAAMSMP